MTIIVSLQVEVLSFVNGGGFKEKSPGGKRSEGPNFSGK